MSNIARLTKIKKIIENFSSNLQNYEDKKLQDSSPSESTCWNQSRTEQIFFSELKWCRVGVMQFEMVDL